MDIDSHLKELSETWIMFKVPRLGSHIVLRMPVVLIKLNENATLKQFFSTNTALNHDFFKDFTVMTLTLLFWPSDFQGQQSVQVHGCWGH